MALGTRDRGVFYSPYPLDLAKLTKLGKAGAQMHRVLKAALSY